MDWSSFPREDVECMLCGQNNPETLSIQRSWPVARCRNCGLIYLSSRPVESALEEMYCREYYESADVGYGGYVENFRKYSSIFTKLFNSRADDIEPFRGDGKLLEVGCAHGFLLDHLRNRNWNVKGVEVSPMAAGYAADELGLDVYCGKLKQAGYAEGSFDVVLLLDVLEHLHKPFETLREIGRILTPGGVLLVQCPWELTHWEEKAEAWLKGVKCCTITPDAVPAHLYFFGPHTLNSFLNKGGFEVFRKQSGNYGAIRRYIKPAEISTGPFYERCAKFVYFRMGLQKALYKLAKSAGLGNGLIRYARFNR
jgi:2-polyprenyl-3-methyl-5-hydroxy-6-metoxy-1,4-benzoquinol methylase